MSPASSTLMSPRTRCNCLLAPGIEAVLCCEPREGFLLGGYSLIKLQQPCGVFTHMDAVTAALEDLVLERVVLAHALGALCRDIVKNILGDRYGRDGTGTTSYGRDGTNTTSSRYGRYSSTRYGSGGS